MTSVLWVLIALLLVLLNAFFVAAEFGMVKLRHTRILAIKKKYGVRGKILAEISKHLDAYLSACQLGITLVSLGLGWVGEPAFYRLFQPIISFLGIHAPDASRLAALICAFLFITFLHIIIGELVPKSLAIRQSEKVSIWTAIPLYGFYWLMYPIIKVMNSCSNALLKLIQRGKQNESDYFYSTHEIKLILHGSYLHGELSKEEKKILEHTLDLADLKVTDVMRPADEVITIDSSLSIEAILNLIHRHRYSRYPVYDSASQQIIGIIHVKDVFSALYQKKKIHLKNLIRPILKVTRRLPALELFRKFREGMPHFALVYSGKKDNLIGFVTLDNLLHVLVGRIKDEFHRTQDDWIKDQDGSYIMRGSASVYTLERALDIDIEDEQIEEDVDTINGLLLSHLEAIPKVKQKVAFNQFDLTVEKMKGPRVLQVRIYPKNKL